MFVAVGQIAFYAALRGGWSERFADPALTAAQIVFGIVAVDWGYLICGPVRGFALFPLLLIFTFGAFSLSWRRMMWLTAFALTSLLVTVATLHAAWLGIGSWSLADGDLRMDLTNVLMCMILLPALSLVATRLSILRSKLRAQRAALTGALAEVQRLATRDELTGLANRRHMQERLDEEQHRSARNGHPFSVAVIDLDHFKRINDAHGHARGDAVLRGFASRCGFVIARLRPHGSLGRRGVPAAVAGYGWFAGTGQSSAPARARAQRPARHRPAADVFGRRDRTSPRRAGQRNGGARRPANVRSQASWPQYGSLAMSEAPCSAAAPMEKSETGFGSHFPVQLGSGSLGRSVFTR